MNSFSIVEVFDRLHFKNPIPLDSSQRYLVICVEHDPSHRQFILKFSEKTNKWVFNEARILSKLSHPNIVTLVDSFLFSPDSLFCLIFEKVEGVSLISFVLREGPLIEEESISIVIQLLKALSFIHSKGFLHRDIKPDNIIFSPKTGIVKLIDFEFCCPLWKHQFGPLKLKHKEICGTRDYQAPEVIKGSYGGSKSDVWSLGVTLFILMTGNFPFSNLDILNKWWNDLEWKVPIVETYSIRANEFLRNMLKVDPNKRDSVDQLKKNQWIIDYFNNNKFE